MEILEKVQQYMVQKILLNEGVSIFRKHVHLFSQLKFSFVILQFFQSQDFRVSDFQCEFLWEKSVLDTVEAPMPRAFYDFPNKIIKCKCKWIHTSPARPVESEAPVWEMFTKNLPFLEHAEAIPLGEAMLLIQLTGPKNEPSNIIHFLAKNPNTSQSCDGFYFKPTFAAASFKAGKCEGAKKTNGFCTNFFVGNNNNWAVGKQNLVIFHEILIGMCVSNIWI